MSAPLKKVVKRIDTTNKYCRPGEGRRKHHLECGHVIVTKQSDGNPTRKRCRDCAEEEAFKKAGSATLRELQDIMKTLHERSCREKGTGSMDSGELCGLRSASEDL